MQIVSFHVSSIGTLLAAADPTYSYAISAAFSPSSYSYSYTPSGAELSSAGMANYCRLLTSSITFLHQVWFIMSRPRRHKKAMNDSPRSEKTSSQDGSKFLKPPR